MHPQGAADRIGYLPPDPSVRDDVCHLLLLHSINLKQFQIQKLHGGDDEQESDPVENMSSIDWRIGHFQPRPAL